ncbi:nucleotide sugar dehydrogenase [Brevibacillus sp. SAFN-007a]|uniref:nucleotide sugar dehydrogenase n=1 Tax=Brevibacillus sp. SAFN-007a TaxID=3436862 RepID=UPI003F7D9B0E
MRKKVGVVGLGYVGLPVAVAFGQKVPVIGYDVDRKRITALQAGWDETGEHTAEELARTNVSFTDDPGKLAACDFIIVTVPTPVDKAKRPDLRALLFASETVGTYMQPGTIVVYESTVYPGATEEVCVPALERSSGKRAGEDFFVGYSPERINPGDKERKLAQIVKVVSGQNRAICDEIAEMYALVVEAGIHKASSIQVAEAAKVIENTQRDLNIALINELAIIFDRLGIATAEVLEAAATKWNFLPFAPGLVGGHCIGVDPYYLTYKAESVGYHPQVILAGRRINDGMGKFVATSLVKQMIWRHIPIQGSRVTILGMTFKENVPDIRNSRVIDIVHELREFGVEVQVTDDLADPAKAWAEYGIRLMDWEELQPADALVLAVPHARYVHLGWGELTSLLHGGRGVIADVKSVLNQKTCPSDIVVWRL